MPPDWCCYNVGENDGCGELGFGSSECALRLDHAPFKAGPTACPHNGYHRNNGMIHDSNSNTDLHMALLLAASKKHVLIRFGLLQPEIICANSQEHTTPEEG